METLMRTFMFMDINDNNVNINANIYDNINSKQY